MMPGSDILLTTLHVITDWPITPQFAASAVNDWVLAGDLPPGTW
ncbi:unnamed protein product [Staurois parvus]|uniref:Uncharacterized protein n=1 Tax=Staurois parvus TaxID=386267 RepID=A0ABN9CL55_9NEOB|nr:unnamed protein product [Staurois parvus]